MDYSDNTFVYVANSRSDDIAVFRLGSASGELSPLGKIATGAPVNPLAVSPDRRVLYAAIRGERPSIAAYAIDSRTGALDPLGAAEIDLPAAHIAVDAGGRFLFTASYHGGSLGVYPIGPNGLVQPEAIEIRHPGRNPHFVLPDPSNRFVYVPCLGSGHIAQFLFDEKTGTLAPNRPAVSTSKHLSGPRHFCFSPNNRFMYVLKELSGEIVSHAIDPATGALSEKQTISYIPPGSALEPEGYVPPVNARKPGAPPRMWGADIHITPDGRFVYASERSGSTITAFSADTATGTLAFVECVETETQPRSFAICPKGRYLVAAGEKSDGVSVHAIDRDKGTLTRVGRHEAGGNPNWVTIVDFR